MNHGNYEVVFKSGKGYISDWSKYQEKIIVVEADSKGDAENLAIKQIKSMGRCSYKIISIKFLKRTPNNIDNYENETISAREEWKNKTTAEKKASIFLYLIFLGILAVIIMIALKS